MVTAAELLSVAAFLEGKHAQAFPSFGSERMGAPVASFCRIDDRVIRLREPVIEPDAVVVQDATLLRDVPVFQGRRPDGFVVLNSVRSLEELGISDLLNGAPHHRVVCLSASDLARRHVGRPLPNVPLLGALAALTKIVHIDSVVAAVRDRFGGEIADRNVAATRAAFELVAGNGVSPCSVK